MTGHDRSEQHLPKQLKPLEGAYKGPKGPLLAIVLDGFGIGKHDAGDCVFIAQPHFINSSIEEATKKGLYCQLKAHGTAVGLPDDTDMGNSEVGHNALGSGQIIAQGAKLVNNAIADGSLFSSENWDGIVKNAKKSAGSSVHLFGLLSDGNVHSHIDHVVSMLRNFDKDNVASVKLHILTDGRDVPSMSSLTYVDTIEAVLAEINGKGSRSYHLASGGGRMYVTMDRYESDWNIVKRGWDAMVHGKVDPSICSECADGWTGLFKSTKEAIETARRMFPAKTDQDYPPWVIVDDSGTPIGLVKSGDSVICFNFRGDRAIQISKSFETKGNFNFDRGTVPDVHYYGMLIYDADQGIPKKSLAPNPVIHNVLTEYLSGMSVKEYAIAETHKFGHMTYFWNGNRSGYMFPDLEKYDEIKSEPNSVIAERPAMKVYEVTEKLVSEINGDHYKFLRVNFANGDMVGHTGFIPPTVQCIKDMDACLKKVVDAVLKKDGIVLVTADHGNCEEELDNKGKPKTSHTTNPVPFFIIDSSNGGGELYKINAEAAGDKSQPAGLTNVAATICNLLGYEAPASYRKSLITFA